MRTCTQVTLDRELQRRARCKAAELGISFAEYDRRIVARDVGGTSRQADVAASFDLGRSQAPTDVARDKDRLVGEAVSANHREKA